MKITDPKLFPQIPSECEISPHKSDPKKRLSATGRYGRIPGWISADSVDGAIFLRKLAALLYGRP
ncbi:MAG: hypothetical protein DMF29_11245 [Verrucomicrobia bacterium]|nr:MAG: hypothetical protein DMF29_11245 [Verrucomicrobiota bacterium]